MRKLKWNCVALLSTLLAVSPVVLADEQCSLEGFDVAPLTKSIWGVPTSGTRCPNNKTCTYIFSICYRDTGFTLCGDASACVLEPDNTTSKLNPLGGVPILHRVDERSFQVKYEYNSTSVLSIQFECDAQQTIGESPGSAVQMLVGKLHARTVFKTSKDTTIVVGYAGACPKVKPEPKPSMIGPGGQVFLVLLVIGALYFGGGAVYNHVNGARGVELLPHHWFWTNLMSYVVDGCLFLVRVVTCQRRPAYSQNPDYGATSPSGVPPSGRTYENL